MKYTYSSTCARLLSIFAIIVAATRPDVSVAQIPSDVSPEADEVVTSNREDMCPTSVASQCGIVEREDQLKTLETRTFESTGNLESYRSGAEFFDRCWACFSPENIEGFCFALEHAKSTVMERIFLPLPTPCETYIVPFYKKTSNDMFRLMCTDDMVTECDVEEEVKNLSSRTSESTGNLQSYQNGTVFLDKCWTCLSEANLEDFCMALEYAKSTVLERIFLSLPDLCEQLLSVSVCTSECDFEEEVKILSSRTSGSRGNLQSYQNGTAFLDKCSTCLSEANLEDFCMALEHAKSTVMERIFLPTHPECESPPTSRSKSVLNNQAVYIQSTFNFDDSEMPWCLQAMNIRKNAKLSVKPCQYHTKQKWVFEDGFLFLSEKPEFCVINVKGKVLKLGFCNDRNIALFTFDDTKGGILAVKGDKRFYFGFPTAKINGKVRLYTEESKNEALSLWKLDVV